jgi:RimJ/RimL family protein N-acetyltransferase
MDQHAETVIEGEGITLRPWDDDLAAQMACWQERGFPFHGFDLSHLRDPAKSHDTVERMRRDRRHRHFVACEGATAVGRVSVNLHDRAGLYIWAVHVPPDHEGRGVCRRMLRALIDWLAVRYPSRDVVLTTNTFAKPAHRAYRAIGFEIVEKRWQYDEAIARALLRGPRDFYVRIAPHVRYTNGRWEVRTLLMRYRTTPPSPHTPRMVAGRSR